MIAISAASFASMGLLAQVIEPAQSAGVLAQLYTLSLTTTIPAVAAALVAFTAHRSSAAHRALVWRSASVAVGLICVGHLLALQMVTAAVPEALARPLVTLGKLQLTDSVAASRSGSVVDASSARVPIVQWLFVVWGVGAGLAAMRAARGVLWVRAALRRADATTDAAWRECMQSAAEALGVRRSVTLRTGNVRVPFAYGVIRPTIVLPEESAHWSDDERRSVLLHELAHVRAGDVMFASIVRMASVVLWFHPAMWLIARQLRAECEHAADDRVLSLGVRASDYAELLLATASNAEDVAAPRHAFALSSSSGLRARLTAIVDSTRDRREPLKRTVAFAATVVVTIAMPLASVRLSPTREVLTTLMAESQWESRAYAVMGLAQRADTLDVARAAAVADPSPRVRAWAKLALSRSAVARGAARDTVRVVPFGTSTGESEGVEVRAAFGRGTSTE